MTVESGGTFSRQQGVNIENDIEARTTRVFLRLVCAGAKPAVRAKLDRCSRGHRRIEQQHDSLVRFARHRPFPKIWSRCEAGRLSSGFFARPSIHGRRGQDFHGGGTRHHRIARGGIG